MHIKGINKNSKNVIFALISLLVVFLLFEGGYRIYESFNSKSSDVVHVKSKNNVLMYELAPNTSYEENGIIYRINADGFRDKEYNIEKSPETIRVVVIGDSVTFGAGVNLNESFTEVLENMLNEKHGVRGTDFSKFEDFEVLNFGISGYGTVQEVEMLDARGLKYEPDVVIVAYVLNDPGTNDIVFSPKSYPSHFAGLIYTRAMLITRKLYYAAFLKEDYINFIHSGNSFENVGKAFDRLSAMAKEKNFKAYVIIFPVYFEGDYKWKDVHAKVKAGAEQSGLKVIDLYDNMINTSSLNPMTDPYHPNPEGHRIAARAIYDKIFTNMLVNVR